jgi:hypothetical protein
MEAILHSIDKFFVKNDIKYCVTGTVALRLLGAPSSHIPQDLDVRVYELTPEQRQVLEDLQGLNSSLSSNYESTCYKFLVHGYPVNAICVDTPSMPLTHESIPVVIKNHEESRVINVHCFRHALEEKMKLGRAKDHKYLIDLIKNMTHENL